ncbi:SDR family oxidoreductase [Kitasatospora sp. NPDC048540]|uniref:SDR family oxidoreductase n=1 Tax=unclassified Kitasatospora TaxID=2633591 RepID=UPI00053A7CF5|nr:SDR family oxidoreductase [Kitasatospora sp. MBT63]
MARRWLVTGCSSGLGAALAEAVAAAGDTVLATARKPAALDELAAAHPDRVRVAALDIRDPDSCAEAVRIAEERLGGIDVLVNNAATGLLGAVEEVSDEELREQLEVLAVAPWRLTRLVLPGMRARGAGHIVNVSSIAGRLSFPGMGAYVAGKHALEGMTQALAAEVAPFGIRVTAVEPGGFATRYGSAAAEPAVRIPAYRGAAVDETRDGVRGMAHNPELGRPEDFAALVLRLVATPGTPLRVPIGADAYQYLEAVHEMAGAELAAAKAFAQGG